MGVKESIMLVSLLLRKDKRNYYFAKPDFPLKPGDMVIIENNNILNLGKVVSPFIKMDVTPWDKIREKQSQGRILRIANEHDIVFFSKLTEKENAAFKTCKEKIATHNLPMHLIEAIWDENEKKYIFYFTADSRIDFRDLVKDLAAIFNARIQLWQVGARDAMRFFGGLGPCGYPTCCTSFLKDIEAIELSYARMQNLPMNATKLTGACGKLVCCLRYELKKEAIAKPEEIIKEITILGDADDDEENY
jgi:cell fate regulator YaaT (PSP1 superfamily)